LCFAHARLSFCRVRLSPEPGDGRADSRSRSGTLHGRDRAPAAPKAGAAVPVGANATYLRRRSGAAGGGDGSGFGRERRSLRSPSGRLIAQPLLWFWEGSGSYRTVTARTVPYRCVKYGRLASTFDSPFYNRSLRRSGRYAQHPQNPGRRHFCCSQADRGRSPLPPRQRRTEYLWHLWSGIRAR